MSRAEAARAIGMGDNGGSLSLWLAPGCRTTHSPPMPPHRVAQIDDLVRRHLGWRGQPSHDELVAAFAPLVKDSTVRTPNLSQRSQHPSNSTPPIAARPVAHSAAPRVAEASGAFHRRPTVAGGPLT